MYTRDRVESLSCPCCYQSPTFFRASYIPGTSYSTRYPCKVSLLVILEIRCTHVRTIFFQSITLDNKGHRRSHPFVRFTTVLYHEYCIVQGFSRSRGSVLALSPSYRLIECRYFSFQTLRLGSVRAPRVRNRTGWSEPRRKEPKRRKPLRLFRIYVFP